jgi:branched-chain amino acid transport system substrate-binding protein
MRTSTKLFRLLALLLTLSLFAIACGSDDDTDTGSSTTDAPADDGGDDEPADTGDDEPADTGGDDEPADTGGDDEPADDGNMADDSMTPVKIGLIAQDEELFAFPEVRAVAQAYVDYANAEQGGIDGHPVQLEVCGAGDAPEGHVGCAQGFVNDDDINLVINAGFLSNSAASSVVLTEGGVPVLTLGNDFVDYLTPGVFTIDPGLPGLAQVFFVYAAENRGVTTATLFIADDPAFEPFIPVLEAIAGINGITLTETVKLGFEPDLTGPVSAADPANEGWLFVLADGAQCTAAAQATATVGYEGQLFANDLCMSQDTIESGALDGWAGPVVSSAPTVDGDDVDEINRILDTYGNDDVQTAGLAGWALGSTQFAIEVLASAGADEATRESTLAALGTHSSSEILGMADSIACPGPGAWTGACNQAPLMVTVDGNSFTAPDPFTELDFTVLDFLLEG